MLIEPLLGPEDGLTDCDCGGDVPLPGTEDTDPGLDDITPPPIPTTRFPGALRNLLSTPLGGGGEAACRMGRGLVRSLGGGGGAGLVVLLGGGGGFAFNPPPPPPCPGRRFLGGGGGEGGLVLIGGGGGFLGAVVHILTPPPTPLQILFKQSVLV